MSGLKKYEPALRSGQLGTQGPVGAITPDEIDDYCVYNVINPTQAASGAGATWVGTRTSGTADTKTIVVRNAILDYPRNLLFAIAGSSVGMAGTATVNGRDQFGSVIAESFGFGSADNGGTVVGTKVFAHFTDGTINFGTFAGANGTARLGVGVGGTTSLFGLPVRLGGTTDVKLVTCTTGTGAVTVNGGTIAAFVDVPMSAVKAPLDITGTYTVSAWVKPTYNPEAYSINADLPQRT